MSIHYPQFDCHELGSESFRLVWLVELLFDANTWFSNIVV